jgi:hypothetical protein
MQPPYQRPARAFQPPSGLSKPLSQPYYQPYYQPGYAPGPMGTGGPMNATRQKDR